MNSKYGQNTCYITHIDADMCNNFPYQESSCPYYSQKSMQSSLNISRNTASKYFSELVRIGITNENKYKNDKVYFCPEFHELLK
jgi:hypothetical protein